MPARCTKQTQLLSNRPNIPTETKVGTVYLPKPVITAMSSFPVPKRTLDIPRALITYSNDGGGVGWGGAWVHDLEYILSVEIAVTQ